MLHGLLLLRKDFSVREAGRLKMARLRQPALNGTSFFRFTCSAVAPRAIVLVPFPWIAALPLPHA
jgi:hypothetical protein